MTKAEARARFYARAELAGETPVSMMAVHHEGEKMAEMYWVLKNRNGSYMAKGAGEFRLTAARRYAMRFASASAARNAEDRKPEWGFEVFRVTRRGRSAPLSDARRQQVERALRSLAAIEQRAASVRACLEAPTPGFPLYTDTLTTWAIDIERAAAAHHALAEADNG